MTLFDMKGKVAVITGSTRGIGLAIAERMAEHGAKVVISSRKADVCDQVAKSINDRFGKGTAVAIAANISSKENLQNLIDESNRAFGKIDVLVCNAASNPYYGPLAGISDDQFRKILDNNIVANNWLISMVVPQMIERKDGSIIIVSSIGGLKGSTILGAYAISKGRRHAARAQSGLRIWPAQHPRQLHRARPDQDRFRQGIVGQSREFEGFDRAFAAAPYRHPRRDRGRRSVPGIEGRRLHDRPDHGDRRRRDDQLRPQ
ncbi:NADP-dependent 3-hydroxy acid dehydrogenase YdfG [Bradyrhizobium sp. LB9.1b]